MYSCYIDGRMLFDPRIEESAITSPLMELEANKIGALTFTIHPNHAEYGNIEKITSTISVYKDGTLISQFRPSYSQRGFRNSIKYKCEELLARLKDFRFRPFDYQGSIVNMVTMVLNDYNSRCDEGKEIYLGNILVEDGNDYVHYSSIDYLTHWEILQTRLVNTHGGFFKARYTASGVFLDYLRDEDLDVSTQEIVFGENLTDLFIETDSEETYSVLVPLGAQVEGYDEHGDPIQKRLDIKTVNGGLDYIENEAGIALYGRRETVQIWDDVTLPENLLTKGRTYLDTIAVKFNENVELTAIDLHNADLSIETFNFLDWVQVRSSVHNLQNSYILRRVSIPLGSPDASKIVLGEQTRTLTDRTNLNTDNLTSAIQDIQSGVERIETEIPDIPSKIVTNVAVEYYLSTSNTQVTGGSWGTQAPVWVDGKYMWSRIVTYYSDNTSVISNTTCIAGATGATGAAGTNGTNGTNGKDGKDGKDGTSVTILGSYDTLADLTREHPTGTAGDSYIVDGDLYVWSTNTSAWVNVGQIQGEPGADGQPGANGEPGEDGVGVSSIDAQYYLSTSKTDREGGQWLDTCPPWESGKYLWTRSKITYTDSTVANPHIDYTEPYCDSSWEAVNVLEDKVDINFDDVRQAITENEQSLIAIIGTTETEILAQVLEQYVGKSEFGTYKETVGTQFNQTQSYIEARATTLQSYVDESTSDMRQYVNGVQTYMRYSTNGLELGALGSVFKTVITNTRISFLQSNEEIAYISNRKLYITEAQITSRLLFGSNTTEVFAWLVTETGFGCRWLGE